MWRSKVDFCIFRKYTSPLSASSFEKFFNLFFQLDVGLSGIAEFQIVFFVSSPDLFIIEFCKDQFEDFFKDIHPSIGKYFIFHFQNQIFQRFTGFGQFVAIPEILHSKRLLQYICQSLSIAGNSFDVFKIIRIFAVVISYGCAICPNRHACPGGVGIAFKLITTVFGFRLFDFNDNVRHSRIVFVFDDNISPFSFSAEVHRIFKNEAFFWVTVLCHQAFCIELTDNFFRSKFDFLVTDNASYKWFINAFFVGFNFNSFFQTLNGIIV